jgi:multicomponent Na+:H+ antiporter subunit E
MKKKLYSKIFLFLVTFIIWVLLTYSFNIQKLLVGAICSFIVVLLVSDVCLQGQWKFIRPIKYLWFLYYVPIFVWEVVKANLDVAYRILSPDMPIKPGIVKIKTRLKSDIGLTMLANSITLTPGTMSVDIDKENGYIYVHWIYVKTQDLEETTKKISLRLENVLIKIFD